jgi:hypothetical protein
LSGPRDIKKRTPSTEWRLNADFLLFSGDTSARSERLHARTSIWHIPCSQQHKELYFNEYDDRDA